MESYSECEECGCDITVKEWVENYGHCDQCNDDLKDSWEEDETD